MPRIRSLSPEWANRIKSHRFSCPVKFEPSPSGTRMPHVQSRAITSPTINKSGMPASILSPSQSLGLDRSCCLQYCSENLQACVAQNRVMPWNAPFCLPRKKKADHRAAAPCIIFVNAPPPSPIEKVLIYVFDVESSDVTGDLERYRGVLDAVEHNSPDARYGWRMVLTNC